MAMQMLSTTPQNTGDQTTHARIRDVAIEQFGQHGFDIELPAIAEAAGVNAELLTHEFGSVEGLRKACDDYILQSIVTAKSADVQSMPPTTWFAQLAQIESYAPMMGTLCAQHGVRRRRTGTRLDGADDQQRRTLYRGRGTRWHHQTQPRPQSPREVLR